LSEFGLGDNVSDTAVGIVSFDSLKRML